MKQFFTLLAFCGLCLAGSAQTWSELRKEEKITDSYKFHYRSLVYLADDMGLNGEMIADVDRIHKNYKKLAGQLNRSVMDDENKVVRLLDYRAKRDEALAKLMGSEDFVKFDNYISGRVKGAMTTTEKPSE